MINLDKVLPKCKKCEKQIKEIEEKLDLNLLSDILSKILNTIISRYEQEEKPEIHACELYELIKDCKTSRETKLAVIVTILLFAYSVMDLIENDLMKEVESMMAFAEFVLENSNLRGGKYAC